MRSGDSAREYVDGNEASATTWQNDQTPLTYAAGLLFEEAVGHQRLCGVDFSSPLVSLLQPTFYLVQDQHHLSLLAGTVEYQTEGSCNLLRVSHLSLDHLRRRSTNIGSTRNL